MLVGMGTVFVFLTVLVGATMLMSRLVLRFAPPSAAADADESEVIAAITAALEVHRRRR